MSIFTKRTGTSLLATASCLAALTLFNGCGGGGGGGADLNVGINGSASFASAINLSLVPDASSINSACAGRSGDLQLTQVSISVNPNNNQVAVGLAAPNIQGFTFSQGGFDPTTRRVNFRGEAIETNGNRIPVLFDGILNNTREPNSLSGILDFTCWRGFINLVAQTNSTPTPTPFGFPTPTPGFPTPTPGFPTPTPGFPTPTPGFPTPTPNSTPIVPAPIPTPVDPTTIPTPVGPTDSLGF